MESKQQVHNLIILDESGSMESIKKLIIQGFNEIVQTVKGIQKDYPEQEHFISFVTFNGLGIKGLHFNEPVSKLQLIDENLYKPDASTPLYDAMGFSFAKLRNALENKTGYNVLVTILTDGEENASKEFTGAAIKNLIDELKLQGWTFTYIGTEHDVENFAASISINNTFNFNKNAAGIHKWILNEGNARTTYSEKIRMKRETGTGFYEDEKPKV